MKKVEQNNVKSVTTDSYQGTNPLERAYQGKQEQAAQTPEPPNVGSTTSVPANNATQTPQKKE